VTLEIPLLVSDVPAKRTARPRAYWIPPAWREVIERLAAHGVAFERIDTARTVDVEMSRVVAYELGKEPFEGHVRIDAKFARERRRETFPKGSVRVPTDQPLGDLVMLQWPCLSALPPCSVPAIAKAASSSRGEMAFLAGGRADAARR
jgi:hypothetical protein